MVVITGCYAQLKPESISVIEGVDMVVGANDKFKIPDLLKNYKPKTTEIHGCSINNLDYHSSFSLNDRTRSFLKIQDGCDYTCSYCTIPFARGKSRCDSIENIVANANKIAKNGIKEIVITGTLVIITLIGSFGLIRLTKNFKLLQNEMDDELSQTNFGRETKAIPVDRLGIVFTVLFLGNAIIQLVSIYS